MALAGMLAAGSNIEWCEARVSRYAFSPHISELGNTLSSLVYLLPALATLFRPRSYRLPFWFYYTEAAMIAVGLGSALFHSTETYIGEMLDEMPMSFLALGYLFQLSGRHPWCQRGTLSWRIIGGGSVVVTLASWVVYATTHNYEVFKDTFAAVLIGASLLLLSAKPPREGRKYFFVQVALIAIAKAAWLLERHYHSRNTCPTDAALPTYYLHTLWHIFGAAAHFFIQMYSERQCVAVGAVTFGQGGYLKGP